MNEELSSPASVPGPQSSPAPATSAPPAAATAGSLLKNARQAQGLHIAALAASIKVSQRKLEALESDRYEELPDTTFTRALAQAVCRALKIDAEPVLALLPQAPGRGLEPVSPGLNAPFREKGLRRDSLPLPVLGRPAAWGSLALVVAAVALYLVPSGWIASRFGNGTPSEAASAPARAASVPMTIASMATPVTPPASAVAPVGEAASSSAVTAASGATTPAASAASPASSLASAPSSRAPGASAPSTSPSAGAAPAVASGSQPAAAPASGQALVVQATDGPTWVEVRDGRNKLLVSRLLPAGESETLEGELPLRVKIGNSHVAKLSFRGRPVTLPADTVVRLELK